MNYVPPALHFQIGWFPWLIELLVQMQEKPESFKMMPPASTLITRCHAVLDFSNRPWLLSSVSLFTFFQPSVVQEMDGFWGAYITEKPATIVIMAVMACFWSNNTKGISFARLSFLMLMHEGGKG